MTQRANIFAKARHVKKQSASPVKILARRQLTTTQNLQVLPRAITWLLVLLNVQNRKRPMSATNISYTSLVH